MRLVAVPTIAGFALLTLLVSAFNAAILLRDAAYSNIPYAYIFRLMWLRDITAAEVLLPTALYLAVLATFNQWHRDREAFACYAAGVAPARIARAVGLLCLVVCGGVAALSMFARPWAYGEGYRIDRAMAELSTAAMQPDRFYSFGDGVVLSAREIDVARSLMRGVFMERRADRGVQVVHAESGQIQPSAGEPRRRLELARGTSHWIEAADLADRVSAFQTLVYYAPSEAAQIIGSERRARSTFELTHATQPKEVAELQWRVVLPVTAFLLTLIAIEIARALPGSSPYPRFVAGLALYAAVFNLAAVGRTWVENGDVGALPGMLWVPLGCGVLLLVVRRLPFLSLTRPQ